jgi:hypothetical protein
MGESRLAVGLPETLEQTAGVADLASDRYDLLLVQNGRP